MVLDAAVKMTVVVSLLTENVAIKLKRKLVRIKLMSQMNSQNMGYLKSLYWNDVEKLRLIYSQVLEIYLLGSSFILTSI